MFALFAFSGLYLICVFSVFFFLNLSSVLYFPAWTNMNCNVPLRLYSLTCVQYLCIAVALWSHCVVDLWYSCVQDQFDTLDLSDNDIRKLDGFPLLRRLKCVVLNNNRVSLVLSFFVQFLVVNTSLSKLWNPLLTVGNLGSKMMGLKWVRFVL